MKLPYIPIEPPVSPFIRLYKYIQCGVFELDFVNLKNRERIQMHLLTKCRGEMWMHFRKHNTSTLAESMREFYRWDKGRTTLILSNLDAV